MALSNTVGEREPKKSNVMSFYKTDDGPEPGIQPLADKEIKTVEAVCH
jgi:hypothetical protein